jgi:hypothetical protein
MLSLSLCVLDSILTIRLAQISLVAPLNITAVLTVMVISLEPSPVCIQEF